MTTEAQFMDSATLAAVREEQLRWMKAANKVYCDATEARDTAEGISDKWRYHGQAEGAHLVMKLIFEDINKT